jgi:hypothetical protein
MIMAISSYFCIKLLTFLFILAKGHSKMRLPVMKFCGQILYSRTFNDVEKAVTKFVKNIEEKKREMMQIAIGFDIEWKPTFRRGWFCFSFFFNGLLSCLPSYIRFLPLGNNIGHVSDINIFSLI